MTPTQMRTPLSLYAIVAALLFGLSTPAAKLLLGDTSPWMLAGLLYLGSGLGLGLVAVGRKILRPDVTTARIPAADWKWLLLAICFGGILGPCLLMIGLTTSDAAFASLLLNLEGVLTALMAWFIFAENFDKRILLGMVAIVMGSLILSWSGDPTVSHNYGMLLIIGACFCWAIDNNITRKISANDALQIAMLKGLIAGCTNTALAWTMGHTNVVPRVALIAGLIGFFGYGLSLLMFVLSLRHIGTARTGAYFSLAPFVGAAAAFVISAEVPSIQFLLAATLMGIGVWLHLSEHHEHEHVHDELEHEHEHVHDIHHQHDHPEGVSSGEPHLHRHRHSVLLHSHPHYPDIHHTHRHS